MSVRTSITKRHQKRKQRDGSMKAYDRWVLNYTCPKTGQRHQQFYAKQKEAQAAQRDLLVQYEQGLYNTTKQQPTIDDAFGLWLQSCKNHIKPQTYAGYEGYRQYILGPMLLGTEQQRRDYALSGKIPEGCTVKPLLGKVRISELSTADIRVWRNLLVEQVGYYTASRATQRLKAMLQLAAEDYNIRPPAMPKQLGKSRRKEKKTILTTE